jgi:hypothetical protein
MRWWEHGEARISIIVPSRYFFCHAPPTEPDFEQQTLDRSSCSASNVVREKKKSIMNAASGQTVAVVGLGMFLFHFAIILLLQPKTWESWSFDTTTKTPSFSHQQDKAEYAKKSTPLTNPPFLGAMGLVTVKNLLETGFQVTGFERSAYIGGLWHYTKDPETLSVLECKPLADRCGDFPLTLIVAAATVVNVSIDRVRLALLLPAICREPVPRPFWLSLMLLTHVWQGCYTDFPFPKGQSHLYAPSPRWSFGNESALLIWLFWRWCQDTPAHCSAHEVEEYLESYADHFNLRPHLRLCADVQRVWRDDERGKWQVDVAGAPSEYFDKVVMATGPHQLPMMPQFEGEELFMGRLMHSRAFKTYASLWGWFFESYADWR